MFAIDPVFYLKGPILMVSNLATKIDLDRSMEMVTNLTAVKIMNICMWSVEAMICAIHFKCRAQGGQL